LKRVKIRSRSKDRVFSHKFSDGSTFDVSVVPNRGLTPEAFFDFVVDLSAPLKITTGGAYGDVLVFCNHCGEVDSFFCSDPWEADIRAFDSVQAHFSEHPE
jgi:hypothetical protein